MGSVGEVVATAFFRWFDSTSDVENRMNYWWLTYLIDASYPSDRL